MNLRGAAAAAFLRRPDPATAGALLYGTDAMRVAAKRQELVANLAGPDAGAEMRITRITAAESRADPAAVTDALRATGFFPGPRVVLVEGLGEGQAAPVLAALADWRPGDAALVVTAGALRRGSKLRAAFEAHKTAAAIGVYDEPMTRAELDAALDDEGVQLTQEARAEMEALAQALAPGDLRQMLGKLALYMAGAPAGLEDVRAMAPLAPDADADAVVAAAAEGHAALISPLMTRLGAQGVSPVTLAIVATRHFGQLHAAAVGGGVGALRPPLYGPRRDAAERQVRRWGARRLEGALELLLETDLMLRSASRAPAQALMERTLIRLAMMAPE